MRIGNRNIGGVDCELHAETKHGRWSVVLDETQIGTGDTLDKAVDQARVALRKTKVSVSVPFITFDGESGVATGLHAKNGSVLARIGNGKSEQLIGVVRMLSADTPVEKVERLAELRQQVKAANSEIQTITSEHGIELTRVVREAVTNAAKEIEGVS